jgi:hypothetical protein
MNHRADSDVWLAFHAAIGQKYGVHFWLLCDRCLKKLVAANVPPEQKGRRKNEFRDLRAFKKAYLSKMRSGEIIGL